METLFSYPRLESLVEAIATGRQPTSQRRNSILPTSALTNTSRQSFSSYEDANDNDSTDCPDQNCDALSPLPETAENGDLGEDDPDSRSDNEAAQNFLR